MSPDWALGESRRLTDSPSTVFAADTAADIVCEAAARLAMDEDEHNAYCRAMEQVASHESTGPAC